MAFGPLFGSYSELTTESKINQDLLTEFITSIKL